MQCLSTALQEHHGTRRLPGCHRNPNPTHPLRYTRITPRPPRGPAHARLIGNTDYDWYRFLAAQPDVDEVNFWQPSGGGGRVGAVSPGEPFFFRLKSPHNAIAGFGYFASYSALPAWLAWESFGRTNGAADFDEMRARIERYRRRSGAADSGRPGDYAIGCIMVASPVFFPQEL